MDSFSTLRQFGLCRHIFEPGQFPSSSPPPHSKTRHSISPQTPKTSSKHFFDWFKMAPSKLPLHDPAQVKSEIGRACCLFFELNKESPFFQWHRLPPPQASKVVCYCCSPGFCKILVQDALPEESFWSSTPQRLGPRVLSSSPPMLSFPGLASPQLMSEKRCCGNVGDGKKWKKVGKIGKAEGNMMRSHEISV